MIHDVAIIGAGPAGVSCAATLSDYCINSVIIDEQAKPGGQVYRGSEQNQSRLDLLKWLGPDYRKGQALLKSAQQKDGIDWQLNTSLWDIRCEEDFIELGLLRENNTFTIKARHVVLASGAMERPTPFPGWTLPGVMTIGAAQTALKQSGILPDDGVVLAGQGPLLYLYTAQLLAAGIKPKAILDFSRKWPRFVDLSLAVSAMLNAPLYILKGLSLRHKIKQYGIAHYFDITELAAEGENQVKFVSFKTNDDTRKIATNLLLVHDGVIPNAHISVAAGCQHNWNDQQQAWHPQIEVTGQSTVKRLWIIGDGAGILGADAATLQGANCGYHIARDLNKMVVAPLGLKKRLHKLRQLREFLDRLYAPVNFLNKPTDETIVCRCEAITAGAIRQIIQKGCMGPNQLRAFCRAGMGPCMGRQCGLTIGQIFSEKLGTPMHNIGYFSIRPPLKPLTIEQLSSLKFNEDCKD